MPGDKGGLQDGRCKACLVIKVDCRMGGVKHALKQTQGRTVKKADVILPLSKMLGNAMIHSIISVMDVKLGVAGIFAWPWKNGASFMNELSTQDIRVRAATTLVDSTINYFAHRSHRQRVVVKKDVLVKG